MTIPPAQNSVKMEHGGAGDQTSSQDKDKLAKKKLGSENSTAALPVISLKVLPILKERQQQHGLRHGDYQRYHGYCSRRLRRLREALKLPQGDRRHFKKKDVTLVDMESAKGNERYLEIPLTMAERGWAFAMELKEYANTERRKSYHLIGRLQKAMGHANDLLALATECTRVDARTKLECEAYSSFIQATFYFEMQLWTDAVEAFKKAQAIYTQIGQALGDHPEALIYTEKTTELLPSMRFCAYRTGEELDISELSSEFQSAAIEAMISQKPKMSEVMFREHKIPVPTEKVAEFLVRLEEFEKIGNKKVENYEEILVVLRDAVQNVRDAIQKDQEEGKPPKPSMILSYLLYIRLKLTNSRTQLMMSEKNQPRDCIRLTEMILHNLQEMKTIQGLDSEDFQNELDEEINIYKGVRCRYVADVYKANKKWVEAMALKDLVQQYFQKARKVLPSNSPSIKVLEETEKYMKALAIQSHARIILSSRKDTKMARPEEPLEDRLDKFILDESLVSGEPNITTFPPEFEIVSCKPQFFDLAVNAIALPQAELEEAAGVSQRKSSPSKDAGLTGFVKGLWGWGGKK